MIVPHYWAEAKIKQRIKGRQISVKRFGWSNLSEAEALQHAENRAAEAIALLEAGKKITQHEPKIPYNGAEGVPIREEIVEQFEDCVITRNSYGALCLNTPDVLFADIDFENEPSFKIYLLVFFLLMVAAGAGSFLLDSGKVFAGLAFAAVILTSIITLLLFRLFQFLSGGAEKRAKSRISRFSKKHPDWHLRIYRTPAGYRVLVMHKTFDPNAQETLDFFSALKSDPIYIRMCQNQRCFRARVSPKPWRIGLGQHIKPRPGVWPVNPDRMQERLKWIENYEKQARHFAACHFEEKIGSNLVNSKAEQVRSIHDKYCNAGSHWPMA